MREKSRSGGGWLEVSESNLEKGLTRDLLRGWCRR